LVWLLTGNLGQSGGLYAPATFVPIVRASRNELDPLTAPRSPVVGARILPGLIPCNVIPDEILTDHPKRYRALIVESRNPPRALTRGQSADARSHHGAGRRRGHRRVHDRDGATGRLCAAGGDTVRKVRSHVLQLRVSAQRVPSPPAAPDAAGGSPARARDPCT